MDWGRLFLSAEGRIGQKDYWIGVLILIVLWILSHLAHIFAPLIWLVLIYPWICVYAKRLHDFGRSGWMVLVPILVGVIAVVGALVAGGAALIGMFFAASANQGNGDFFSGGWAGVVSAFGVALAFLCVAGLAKLIFLIWVGANRGDPAPNRYGPPPGQVTATPAVG